MAISSRIFAVLLILLAALRAAGAGGDLIQPELIWNCGVGSRDTKQINWKFRVSGSFAGSLGAGGGRIMVGASDFTTCTMTALDTSGRVLWQARHPSLNSRVHDYGQPIHSVACFDGSRAYYVSNRGELMCVNLEGSRKGSNNQPLTSADGRRAEEADVVWKIDMMKDLGVFKRDWSDVGNPLSSPIIIGDLVFCVTGHGVPPGASGETRADPKPPSFLAVQKMTGKVAWSSNAPNAGIIFSQWSSPVQARVNGADQVIFPGGDGILYGFEPATGRLLWKLDCNPPGALDPFRERIPRERQAEARCGFVAMPIVHGTKLYVSLNENFESPQPHPLLAIDLAAPGGQPKLSWQFGDPAFKGTMVSAAVDNGLVFVTGNDGMLFALDEKSGRECWRARCESDARNLYASPVIYRGRVYAGGESAITVFEAARERKCVGQYQFDQVYLDTPKFAGDQMFVAVGEFVYALRVP